MAGTLKPSNPAATGGVNPNLNYNPSSPTGTGQGTGTGTATPATPSASSSSSGSSWTGPLGNDSSAVPQLDQNLQTAIFDLGDAPHGITKSQIKFQGSTNADLTRVVDLMNAYMQIARMPRGKDGNFEGPLTINPQVIADLRTQTSDRTGKGGIDLRAGTSGLMDVLSHIDSGFRSIQEAPGGTVTLDQRQYREIRTRILSDIGNHLGVTLPKNLSAEQLANFQLPEQVGQRLGREGYNVARGAAGLAKIGDLTDLFSEQGTTAKARTETTPSSGGDTKVSGQDYFNNFVRLYSDPNNQKFQQATITALQDAGLLGEKQPSPNQVYTAEIQLMSAAAQNKRSLSQQLTTMQNSLTTPQDKAAETQGSAGAAINAEAEAMGVNLTAQQRNLLTEQTIAGNWTSDQIRHAVAGYYQYTPGGTGGGYGSDIANAVTTIAGDYQVPISQQSIGSFVTNAIRNGEDPTAAAAQYQNMARESAMGLYPTLAPQIQAGQSVKNLVDPYLQLAQQVLGVDANSLMLDNPAGVADPKWSAFLNYRNPQTGAAQTMTLDQWKQTLMSNPQYGFQHTQAARNISSSLVDTILNTFGKVSTGSAPDIQGQFSQAYGA